MDCLSEELLRPEPTQPDIPSPGIQRFPDQGCNHPMIVLVEPLNIITNSLRSLNDSRKTIKSKTRFRIKKILEENRLSFSWTETAIFWSRHQHHFLIKYGWLMYSNTKFCIIFMLKDPNWELTGNACFT